MLRRIGENEFGGPILSTVGDVVEATGKEPLDIGRVLGEIRSEAFEQRFGIKLESHEQRIEQLEDITERIQSRPQMIIGQPAETEPFRWGEYAEELPERVEIADEVIENKEMFTSNTMKVITYLIVFCTGFVILFVAATLVHGMNNR